MGLTHHQVSIGAWLIGSEVDSPSSDWFVLHDASLTDAMRNATKAVLSSDRAQIVHNHSDTGRCTAQTECIVLVPGPDPEEDTRIL